MRALFPTLMTAAALALLATGPAQAADCSAARGCAAKFCQIENDIAQAQAHGNSRQEAGLRRALAEAKAHCTDSRLQNQREADVRETEQGRRTRRRTQAGSRQGQAGKDRQGPAQAGRSARRIRRRTGRPEPLNPTARSAGAGRYCRSAPHGCRGARASIGGKRQGGAERADRRASLKPAGGHPAARPHPCVPTRQRPARHRGSLTCHSLEISPPMDPFGEIYLH